MALKKNVRKVEDCVVHEWGQSAASVYEQVCARWSQVSVGGEVCVISHKQRGVQGLVRFFEDKGLHCEIVERGSGGVRVLSIQKESEDVLPTLPGKTIEFSFQEKKFHAHVDEALFSQDGLDEGTKVLLQTVLASKIDLNGKNVGDVGAGWGALPLILQEFFPETKLFAYEKDFSSFLALQKNVSERVKISRADLTDQRICATVKDFFDVVVSNPPFHTSTKERDALFVCMSTMLKLGGQLFFVVQNHFVGRFQKTLRVLPFQVKEITGDAFTVFQCTRVHAVPVKEISHEEAVKTFKLARE